MWRNWYRGFFSFPSAGRSALRGPRRSRPQPSSLRQPTSQKLEEVVVTGSRIRQSEQNFANPVTTFSADTIVRSGKTDLA